jgi:hypothetical protein
VIASLILGKLFDRFELPTLHAAVFLSSLFSPILFFCGSYGVMAGVVFLGIAYATQDTLLKAIIAGALPEGRRSSAFGLFSLGYGSGWLVGSVASGFLYSWWISFLAGFLTTAQLLSLPIFFIATRFERGMADVAK